jgi:hypothetical protein
MYCNINAVQIKPVKASFRGTWRLVGPYPAVSKQRVALLDENRLDEGDICGAQHRLSTVVDAKYQQQPQQHILLYHL